MTAVITSLQFRGFHDPVCTSNEMESVVCVPTTKVRGSETLRKWQSLICLLRKLSLIYSSIQRYSQRVIELWCVTRSRW